MMYVPYPSLSLDARLAGLAPLETERCCAPIGDGRDAVLSVGDHAVEMLAGRPVLRFTQTNGERHVVDLETGHPISVTDAAMVAGLEFARRQGWPQPRFAALVERDQWTVQGRYDPHRPLSLFRDAEGREWYVSARTGEVVQLTGTSERFWNWLGAVEHWLYPTVLRQHTVVWSQVVIVLTLAAVFLTVTGLVIGLRQYRAGNGRPSPYRGWLAWHHFSGLAFGVLTLTWLFSGLLSMNPWGWLESRSFAGEIRAVNGGRASLSEVVGRIGTLMAELPPGTVRVEGTYWLDRPEYLARTPAGEVRRLGLTGEPAPIDTPEAAVAAGRLRPDVSPGRILLAVDGNARAARWLFAALHQGDFHALVRSRPAWDVMMLAALAGVIAGVGTGAWLGIRRLLRRRTR